MQDTPVMQALLEKQAGAARAASGQELQEIQNTQADTSPAVTGALAA